MNGSGKSSLAALKILSKIELPETPINNIHKK